MKKIILYIFLILILSVVIIKIFVGKLFINVEIPYYNPIYSLNFNNEIIGVDIEIRKNTTIIPKTVYITSYSAIYNNIEPIEIEYGEEMNLDIKGYYCFTNLTGNKTPTECKNLKHEVMNEIDNIKINTIEIHGGSLVGETGDLVYKGEYQSNITNLINKKGNYSIKINISHENIDSDLYFRLKVI